ncbi:hypothetical protein IQ270_22350 [Microcoleus sp. LEGE 07076]|uniref:hypothetical protein n=1 Tax=Microcoleus sp. LEGE 07076 TaxID=915322 RepID=UPI001880F118|nr:hypothetical protein [Microcoleus sp. LEGE 07076]MBE9187319.1 hypothetical protein [Microcoleus sp. LEGE 07076]
MAEPLLRNAVSAVGRASIIIIYQGNLCDRIDLSADCEATIESLSKAILHLNLSFTALHQDQPHKSLSRK